MRILTILTGFLFIGAGAYVIANEGISFLSVAFVVGLAFLIAGIVECLSYGGYRGDNEEKSWILIDGTTTFVLGVLIILNKITEDRVVVAILGLWVIITGIRNFVRAADNIAEREHNFYDHLIVGVINLACGLYVFFDKDIFNLPAMTMMGLCVCVQGINIIHVGATIKIIKPELLKTKKEIVEDARAKVEEVSAAAKEAMKQVKAAKAELKAVESMPAAALDVTVAPKPKADPIIAGSKDKASGLKKEEAVSEGDGSTVTEEEINAVNDALNEAEALIEEIEEGHAQVMAEIDSIAEGDAEVKAALEEGKKSKDGSGRRKDSGRRGK